jgi:hypothetical protein
MHRDSDAHPYPSMVGTLDQMYNDDLRQTTGQSEELYPESKQVQEGEGESSQAPMK